MNLFTLTSQRPPGPGRLHCCGSAEINKNKEKSPPKIHTLNVLRLYMKIFGSHSSLTSSKLTGIIVSGDVALSSRRKRSEICRRGSCHKTLKYELKVTEYSCKSENSFITNTSLTFLFIKSPRPLKILDLIRYCSTYYKKKKNCNFFSNFVKHFLF